MKREAPNLKLITKRKPPMLNYKRWTPKFGKKPALEGNFHG